MKKLIIFDLDGTLLNSVADLGESGNHTLSLFGYPTHSIESYYHFVGNGIAKLIERALPPEAFTPEKVEEMLPHFRQYYNEHMADRTLPYEGIPHLLTQLQESGFALAVASNKYQWATEHLIHHFFPEIHFAALLGQRENIPVKPHPAIVQDIQALTGVSTPDILYVGDSAVDMKTAANASVEAVAVTWGFCSRSELESYSPRYLIEKPQELETLLIYSSKI